MAKTSPTQRTLKFYREMGYTCHITEKWNPHARIRQDAFGFGDILAMRGPVTREMGIFNTKGLEVNSIKVRVPAEIVLIQACAGASHAARRAKILQEPRARTWLQAGGVIEVCSWSKRGDRGKRKLWEPRIERVTLADFDAQAASADAGVVTGTGEP